uniref:deoxyribodipyrimidine photo-lyase n=1 Tax=Chamaesiphon sp. VAR_48_metabat_403 TaxID=2964700 RepID=UPI00286DF16C
MATKRILLWYRNDLRLHDHQPLTQALKQCASIIPLYCFDDRQFDRTPFGFPKTGAFRAQFLLESITDLQHSWQTRGSDLLIRRGLPEVIIPALVERLGITDVYYYQEVTAEEIAVSATLTAALKAINVNSQSFWGQTLYHLKDLPFGLPNIPELFTKFRKDVERDSQIRPALPTPATLPPLPTDLDRGIIPSLADLGLAASPVDSRGVLAYQGG